MMKSKTTQRIMEETSQELRGKVSEEVNYFLTLLDEGKVSRREIQLYKLGFEQNENQKSFVLSKYDTHWCVDFNKLPEYGNNEWFELINDLRYEIDYEGTIYYNKVRQSEEYIFAVKEKNKQVKDKINALKSKLAEEKRQKLTKIINQERVKELEAQIKILQELL
jgi:paraquat-inducible protein B